MSVKTAAPGLPKNVSSAELGAQVASEAELPLVPLEALIETSNRANAAVLTSPLTALMQTKIEDSLSEFD